ncbi:MAG: hypothetical protein DMG40_20840 [Acidobacteria bacterium]|nr:MAG: hypothetical protein DMG40_20840 [Acidobacteriota bacterium]
MRNEKTVILPDALQPAYVQTVEQNYTDLRQLSLLLEAGRLSDSIQIQFLDDRLHTGEVQAFAVIEVFCDSRTKSNLH